MMSPVGQSVAVMDAPDRVNGAIQYVLDLEVPRMAFGRMLRSPHAHARVLNIDTSRAAALPGVFAVLTGADLVRQLGSSTRFGRFFLDQTILAVDKVRFIGEPVVAVAAVTDEAAAEACGLVAVDYEPLASVFTIEDALAADAPLLHDPRPVLRDEAKNMIGEPGSGTNVCSYFKLRHGSIERGFAESDHVFSGTFESPAVQHVPLEPHVAVASYDNNVTVWSSTQMPHAIRSQLAELLGLPLADVRIATSNLGGGFGSKGSLRLEPITSLLSRAAHRPVKIVLDRDEEFVTVTKHPAMIEIKSGVTADGLLKAREVTAYFNTGAYADVGPMVARNAGSAITGPYRIPNVAVDSYAVWSNLVPAGAFRGFGVSQGAWAYESHTDMIAEGIGMDPVQFRRQNLLRDGDRYATGETVADFHFDRLLDRVEEAIRWPVAGRHRTEPSPSSSSDKPSSTRRGKAITTMMKATITPSTSTAALKLNEDGSLNVLTSSVDMGQGVKTVLAQIAAEAVGMAYEDVRVSDPDTDLTPYDQQTSSSRTTYSMGSAVARAADDLKVRLLAAAADLLEAPAEDLEIQDAGVQVRGAPRRRLTFAEIVRMGRLGNVQGTGTFVTEGGLDPETGQGIASVHWHHGAAGCEVKVDIETGKVDVLRFASAVFAGRVINPRLCELQVEGSIMFGLGQALFEEIVYEDGQIVNPNLSDYMIPSFTDMPGRVHISLVEDAGHSDVHGIGETSLPSVSPTIANAVFDAVGVSVTGLPITREKVLRAIVERTASQSEVDPSAVRRAGGTA
jgi:CO/xanthine dehydrogenase Mo-binding subunit